MLPEDLPVPFSLGWAGSNALPENQGADSNFLSSKQSTVHWSGSFPESKITRYLLNCEGGVFILLFYVLLILYFTLPDFISLDWENWEHFLLWMHLNLRLHGLNRESMYVGLWKIYFNHLADKSVLFCVLKLVLICHSALTGSSHIWICQVCCGQYYHEMLVWIPVFAGNSPKDKNPSNSEKSFLPFTMCTGSTWNIV